MSAEYTPTTEDVMSAYRYGALRAPGTDTRGEFDRWLSENFIELKADNFDEREEWRVDAKPKGKDMHINLGDHLGEEFAEVRYGSHVALGTEPIMYKRTVTTVYGEWVEVKRA